MSLSNLSGAQLAQLVGLAKEKEALEIKLDRVNAALQALESGKPVGKRRGRKPGRPAGSKKVAVKGVKIRRGKRLKQPLLKALSAAG